jgi:hypothetical protein
MKYQLKKNEYWDAYQRSLENLTKNAQIYLGDFLVFLLLWVVLFRYNSDWVGANETRFWPVVFFLVLLAWFALFRVTRALEIMPTLLLLYVSTMIRVDPDMASLFEIPNDEREKVRDRIQYVLEQQKAQDESKPSLIGFIGHYFGLRPKTSRLLEAEETAGRPFADLYARGRKFQWNVSKNATYDSDWLKDYVAFLYYRFYHWISNLARSLWQLIRFVITGAP